MVARDTVTHNVLARVEYAVYSGYDVGAYMGCIDTACGNLMASSASGDSFNVPEDDTYLIVASLDGYYSAYHVFYVGVDATELAIEMVEEMKTDQDRVVLSWDFTDDLDLWVYSRDRTNSVGWSRASSMFPGGSITLDVDVQSGPGVETTQFMNLESVVFEVWINHYSDQFNQWQVASTPANVDVFCYRCLDDQYQLKHARCHVD